MFDLNSHAKAIMPGDLNMLTQTLEAWCRHNKVPRKDATEQAKILLQTYQSGKRGQVDLIDALEAQH